MKILWLVNVKLPIIYRVFGQENKTVVAGWLDQISERIIQKKDLELVICYPSSNINDESGQRGNLKYYGIYFNDKMLRNGKLNENKYIPLFYEILRNEKPDIIHIHGTEFQYAAFMVDAANQTGMIKNTVISIQGLVDVYARHYLLGLPSTVIYRKTVKEILLREGVYSGYRSYVRRGMYEKKALSGVKYIIGRTNWDKGCAYIVNPSAEYLFANETLRSNFYSGAWEYSKCIPHSIFVSQASYPIKGFHFLLIALKTVKQFYPDVTVRVAGADLSKDNWVKGSSYGLYIQKLIEQYDLGNNVKFIGLQNAEQMKQELLNANIFVSSSVIENSPNSLGEGMILGVPCISSDVGGVTNLISHNEEGYVYPLDETYMLAYYIIDLFSDKDRATRFGVNASAHAKKTHDAERNFETLIGIYKKIAFSI